MQNSKVVQILKTFSAKEYRDLEKFIASPFFAKGRNVMPLYKYFRKFHPEYSSSKMTAEAAFGKIYPGRKFSLQVIRNLLSTMQRMCEEYLFEINIRRDKLDYYVHLGDELQSRRVFNVAEKNLDEGLIAAGNNGADSNFFYYNYIFEDLKDQMFLKKADDESRIKTTYNLSSGFLSYFITGTKNVFESIHITGYNYNQTEKTNPLYIFINNFVKLDDYIEYLKNNPSEFSEIDEMHIHLIKLCIKGDDEASYLRMRELLRNNFNRMSRLEAFFTYGSLERIVTILKLKHPKYKHELFEVYKEMLSHNIYRNTEDGFISPSRFTGIVVQALAVGDHKWAHNFIKEYKNKILPEFRESRHNHSLALICFAERDYEKALKLISKIKYDAFAFKYYLKGLLLKIYYETNRFEEAISVIDTFRHFISKTISLPQFRKDEYSGFIKYTAQLLKLRENNSGINLTDLKQEIENQKLLAEKAWLLEKSDELAKKKA